MRQPNLKFVQLIKWCFVLSFFSAMTLFLISPDEVVFSGITPPFDNFSLPLSQQPSKNWRNLTQKQIDSLSVLGRYLFLDDIPTPPKDKTKKIFKILTWKVGKWLERRHIYFFKTEKSDPFGKCSVRNCEITYNDDDLPKADAVMIHVQRLKGVNDLPKENGSRPENQRWVFLTDENPIFTFINGKTQMTEFADKFNWSMTFRMESDVPVPSGRTLLKNISNSINVDSETENEIAALAKKKSDVLVAIMGSNCGSKSHRWEYVKELQKHIQVDVYGKCGPLKCPGHFNKDCDLLNNYKFYLSFENSNCAQYITEKVWWNAYAKNSIPILMGATKTDYEQQLPPNSYINVDNFARPVDLARFILYVNKTNDVYLSYFEWKKYYRISNEHGYFQTNSYHYCRLCEALNYNSKEKKVYDNVTLSQFWTKNDCYPAWDAVTDG